MTTPEIVKYVLLGVFALPAFIGFLFGLGRGLSKAFLRLAFFILFAGIALIITPSVSALLLDFPVNVGTINGSLSEIIQNFINSNSLAQSIISSSEVLQAFAQSLPIAVINLVVFVVLLFLASSISWIVFAIFAAIFIKKRNQPQKPKSDGALPDSKLHVNLKQKPQRKYRFLGGLVGVVHSLIFLALILTPATGFISIGTNLMMATTDNVVYADDGEKTPTAKLIDEYIPAEAKEYVQIYLDSPIYYLSKYTGADSFVFDSLTTVKINVNNQNQLISFRGEAYALAKLYDNVEFLTKLDFDNIIFEDLDYDKLETAVNTALSSRLVKTIAPELLNWVIDEINLPENQRHIDINLEQQYVDIINLVVGQYQASGGTYVGLTNDLKVVFDVFKSVGSSGILDMAMSENGINANTLITLALANNRKVVNEVAGNVFNAISLRTILVQFLNEQLDRLTLSQDAQNRVTFSKVSLPNVNWTYVSDDFLDIVNKAIDIYVSLDNSFTQDVLQLVQNDPYQLINADFGVITSKLGQIMTLVQDFDLFVNGSGNKVLYNQFIDYLNNMEFAEYVDFAQFKTANVWNGEMANLNIIISALKTSGVANVVVDNLRVEAGMENLDFNDLIDKLSASATNGNTYASNIIASLLNSVALRKTILLGVDYANNFIESNSSQLGTGVVLGKVQSNALFDASERSKILTFIDNVLLYVKGFDVNALQSDIINTILNSNFTALGTALDSLKNSALVGPYRENGIDYEGIYSAFIHALSNNEQFGQFANWNVALEAGFTWSSEMSYIEALLDELNSIEIDVDGNDKTLIEAVMDGDDMSLIIEELTDENIDNLITPLVSSRLLGKNIVMLVNLLNEQLENILSASIATIPSNAVLTNQVDDIKTIIKSVLDIYPSIKDGLGSTEIQTLSANLGALLNAIKANALRTDEAGVFGGTYVAIINYLRGESTFGDKFSYIYDTYIDPADINWEDFLGLTVDVNNLGSTSAIPSSLAQRLSNILADMFQDEVYGEITGDVIDIVNMFININSLSSEDDILDYVAEALEILAERQGQYVANNVGNEEELKLEFATKVNTVIEFFEGLTGVENFNLLKDVTDYQAELDAINAIDNLMTIVNGEQEPQIEDFENFIEALADSDLVMGMLEDNGIVIELDETLESEITNFIETQFAGNEELINQLKTILNLLP